MGDGFLCLALGPIYFAENVIRFAEQKLIASLGDEVDRVQYCFLCDVELFVSIQQESRIFQTTCRGPFVDLRWTGTSTPEQP